jgi:alkane 1-monooxygenase
MASAKPWGYLLVFTLPPLMPAAAWLARSSAHPDAAAWFPLAVMFGLVPILDYAIGRDTANPTADEAAVLEAQVGYRLLTLACLPVYLALLAWSCATFVALPLSWAGELGWLLSQGVLGGVVAINVAHELIHKPGRLEPWAGGALLAAVGYGGFKVEHVRGHHRWVATPDDPSSAPRGTPVYAFVPRALARNARNAFRLEAERLAARGLPPLSWRNELLWWHGLTLLLAAGFAGTWGPAGALFFAAQALVAAATLEVINYIEHYGLARRRGPDGRYERTTHLHSWNSAYRLSNLLLFQLQRHSDHHAHARRRYQALRHRPDSPQLPGGYPAMFLLALVPPLWFALIHPRLPPDE